MVCKRFGAYFGKFYTGNTARTDNNADWGGIAKAINEYYGQKIEELSLTQINAYILEIVKAQKGQQKAIRGVKTNRIDANTPLSSLKGMGVKIVIGKNKQK